MALACPDDNRHKGPNLTTIDPETRVTVRLFHLPQDQGEIHFTMSGPLIVRLTPMGKATARLVQMNSDERVEMRAELLAAGLWPS